MRVLAFLIACLVVTSAGAYGLFEWLLLPAGTSDKRQIVTIKPGSGVAAIAHQLHERHLIRNELAFKVWLRVQGQDTSLKAGVYAMAPNAGSRALAGLLVEGKGMTTRVTVPEGYQIRQIASLLERANKGAGARFLALTRHAAYFRPEYPWLAELPEGASLEGFLFPDTYVLAPGRDAERDLVRMMLARFEEVAMPVYKASKANSGLSLIQAVTMASLVEKEARQPGERPLIAGVFYNRLATRMPFGSDPTVEYALQRHQGAKGLSFADIKVDSPYNTYVHPGLPPGPIASPGLASMKAAVLPANTQYLYFVARGDGSHAFTRTYAEHLAAQRRIVSGR